jgi:4-hydroxyproline epimerase
VTAILAEVPLEMRVVDSHTEGEPTRIVVEGWPALTGATMAERRDDVRRRFDYLRRAVVCEPRGHAAIVGAILTPPITEGAASGVIFFNNETYLGMCGHGLIGTVRTLQHLGRLQPGKATFDTPVGPVSTELGSDGSVTIQNVPSYAHQLDVSLEVPGVGTVIGDVAWGGNWFFITHLDEPVQLSNAARLTQITQAIQDALRANGITGADGADIDHIEISVAPTRPEANARNFVLCSGGEYDRSPCGTGTSAKMAVLFARQQLEVNQYWLQESVTGSMFTGWLTKGEKGELVPHIRGTAFVTGESTLRFDPADPFRMGLPER